MFYLICNVIFASAFTLCIKWVQVRQREDIITVGPINYITAALLILPEYWLSISGVPDVNAVLTGGWMGACYFIAFFFVIQAIRWVGAAATTVISVLSLLLPIGCGVVLWDEVPNAYQAAGIVLALTALVLIAAQKSRDGESERPWFAPLVLLTFFLLAGLSRLAQATFGHVSVEEQRPAFLLAAFGTAAVPSVMLLAGRRKRIQRTEFAFGVGLGTANILQTHFILKSLDRFPGFIVFPVVSAGGLILTTLIATRLLGERPTPRTYSGIGIAVVALVLLNWLRQ